MDNLPWFSFERDQKKSNVFYSSAWTGIVTKEELAELELFAKMAEVVAVEMEHKKKELDKAIENILLYGSASYEILYVQSGEKNDP